MAKRPRTTAIRGKELLPPEPKKAHQLIGSKAKDRVPDPDSFQVGTMKVAAEHEVSYAKLRRFFEIYAVSGNRTRAAKEAGTSWSSVEYILRMDTDEGESIRAQWARSQRAFYDYLRDEAVRRAVEGVEEPITNPRTGEFVYLTDPRTGKLVLNEHGEPQRAFMVKRSDRLLELLMTRLDPEMKNKVDIDHTVKGGVLVVPASMTVDDWEQQYGGGTPMIEGEVEKNGD